MRGSRKDNFAVFYIRFPLKEEDIVETKEEDEIKTEMGGEGAS